MTMMILLAIHFCDGADPYIKTKGTFMCMNVLLVGIYTPLPLFVLPRVHLKNHFIEGALEDALGVATRSGWINSSVHVEVLKHIQKFTVCLKEKILFYFYMRTTKVMFLLMQFITAGIIELCAFVFQPSSSIR